MKARRVIIRNARDFFNFCKSQFHHNSYDATRKEPQYFIQEFFYVEEILRDDSIVVAVMTEHTCSFFSIHSTGKFCVIEVREVSCCCESCLFRNGKECPNQAYASKWKAINLYTTSAAKMVEGGDGQTEGQFIDCFAERNTDHDNDTQKSEKGGTV